MQEICKIEQATSPPTITSLSPPINPKTLKDLMHIITKLLFEGQESAQIIRSFLIERLGLKVEHHNQVDIDHHCLVTLNSLENSLTLLKSFDFDQEDVMRKRKLDCTNIIESLDHCKAEDHGRVTSSKERRGCYKRRRNGQTWTVEATELVDDGHAWRKYGQKEILNTDFPRSYYRCTHKHDQKCEATKQVQQISKNPTKYNIIYNGEHTCSNLHKSSSIIIDPEENSSIISFETHNKNYPTVKNSLNSCSFFPSTAFQNNNQHAMVKQEHTLIKEELPISPSGLCGTHSSTLQYSSSSDNLPSSSSSNTPVSDQGDSYEYEFDDESIFINLYMDDHTLFHLDDVMKEY